ncbi:CoA-acylating methylmalonate-semialdehyde dehydrogenase [Rothia nasimurium]|uniref:methylmalonate-semialdehyde dehydrogenase (CoA acylating) n=1 Tax=Rothia nasimurium TaxID=85336 RepID=A0A4Y9F2B6_9MICC|nr:CoA-acylating methylmalonate-semialdehyde dehydrogenase [Rothia nasimurium]MBF0808615.1 CoA-acylating methylmalonate-semialdehyde dehydrogenase [Rothia nasimurium]TFU21719.1 CoA-acylating methylmalonate-semialdehyde dehydrogenase [Rothia nasimurium]
MLYEVVHFIQGSEVASAGDARQDIFNPATGETIGTLHMGGQDELQAAVAAAKTAGQSWSEVSLAKRTAILFRFRELLVERTDELAEIVVREHGKVFSDAKGEIARGQEIVEYACGITNIISGAYTPQAATGIDAYSMRQPLGVVAGITPFNFPVMIQLWMAPLAIASGNAFILKPSERDPSAANFIAKLWKEAGLPDGVFNVLHGGKEMVDGLLTHPDVDGISFVGSTPIAKYVYETGTAHGKRVQALGGAKNHALIMPDADMDVVADHLSAAAFGAAGQRCMAISVAVAVGDAAEISIAKVAERAQKIKVSNGMDQDADMGPLITPVSRDRVQRIITEAEQAGAAVVVDGRNLVIEGYEGGNFVGPTILDQVKTEMAAYGEEIFGPVLVVVRVESLEEGIQLINSNPFGNGTCIFTSSGAAARRFTRDIKVGMVGVNVPLPVPLANHSFGGWNDSLFGEHHIYGEEGVRFYTRAKAITQRWPEPKQASGASFNFESRSNS